MKKKKNSMGGAVAVGTAIAGAALGAAAVVLADKNNQQKIKKSIEGLSRDAVELGKNLKKKADEFKKNTKKNEKKAEKKVKKVINKTAIKKPTPPKKK